MLTFQIFSMKKVSTFVLLLVCCCQLLQAQTIDKAVNTIDVLGSSKMLIVPEAYRVQISIQEEEQKVNYQTIGKTPIDSVKNTLFKNLKKYNIEERDLKLSTMSSQPIGQYPFVLNNILYEFQIKDRDLGKQLVGELRFPGLKGVFVRGVYTNAIMSVQDLLYEDAVKDASRIAIALAKKMNKSAGEVKNIQILDRQFPFARDTEDYYTGYSQAKFEMDLKDKFATCNVRVIYELK